MKYWGSIGEVLGKVNEYRQFADMLISFGLFQLYSKIEFQNQIENVKKVEFGARIVTYY